MVKGSHKKEKAEDAISLIKEAEANLRAGDFILLTSILRPASNVPFFLLYLPC